jgi:hypothetical protein
VANLAIWAAAYAVLSRRPRSFFVLFCGLSAVSGVGAAALTDALSLPVEHYWFLFPVPGALTSLVAVRAALRERRPRTGGSGRSAAPGARGLGAPGGSGLARRWVGAYLRALRGSLRIRPQPGWEGLRFVAAFSLVALSQAAVVVVRVILGAPLRWLGWAGLYLAIACSMAIVLVVASPGARGGPGPWREGENRPEGP